MKRHRLERFFFFGLARLSPTRQQIQFKAINFRCDPCVDLWRWFRCYCENWNANRSTCVITPTFCCLFWGVEERGGRQVYIRVVEAYYIYEKQTKTKKCVARNTTGDNDKSGNGGKWYTHKSMLYLWQFPSFFLLYPRSASASVSFFFLFFANASFFLIVLFLKKFRWGDVVVIQLWIRFDLIAWIETNSMDSAFFSSTKLNLNHNAIKWTSLCRVRVYIFIDKSVVAHEKNAKRQQ